MKNKSASSRYRLIDIRISMKTKRSPTLQDLIEYVSEKLDCNVSARTIQYDIRAMRHDEGLGFFAPIEYDATKRAYYYSEPDYSINKMAVSAEDLQGLEMAIGILEQFKNLPAIKLFDDAISKIATSIKFNISNMEKSKIFFLDRPNRYIGIEFLDEIVGAIRNKQVLKIQYKPFNKQELKKHTLHPYFIKEYNGRMYLIAKDIHPTKASKFLTFSFDRIQDAIQMNQTFFEEYVDTENYFSSTIGVSHSEEAPQNIQLQFDASQMNYIKSQPLHASQKILNESKTHIKVAYSLVVNYELKSLLLGFGNTVKVLKPISLAQTIKEMAEKIVLLYR